MHSWGKPFLAAGVLSGALTPCQGAGTTAVRFINGTQAPVTLVYEGVEGTLRGPHRASLRASLDGGPPRLVVGLGEDIRIPALRLRPGGTVTLVMAFGEGAEDWAVSDNYQFRVRQEGREESFHLIYTAMEVRSPGEEPLREATLEQHFPRFHRDSQGNWQAIRESAPPILHPMGDPVRLLFAGFRD